MKNDEKCIALSVSQGDITLNQYGYPWYLHPFHPNQPQPCILIGQGLLHRCIPMGFVFNGMMIDQKDSVVPGTYFLTQIFVGETPIAITAQGFSPHVFSSEKR